MDMEWCEIVNVILAIYSSFPRCISPWHTEFSIWKPQTTWNWNDETDWKWHESVVWLYVIAYSSLLDEIFVNECLYIAA